MASLGRQVGSFPKGWSAQRATEVKEATGRSEEATGKAPEPQWLHGALMAHVISLWSCSSLRSRSKRLRPAEFRKECALNSPAASAVNKMWPLSCVEAVAM